MIEDTATRYYYRLRFSDELTFVEKSPAIHIAPCPACPDWLASQPPRETIAMEPINLKAIARDAALRGDTKTLFHTLDLLEQLMPIATFMDFCTELEELRPRGARPRPH